MVLAAAAIAGAMTVGADANLAVLAGEINRKRNKGHTPTSNFQQCVPSLVPCPVLHCAALRFAVRFQDLFPRHHWLAL